MRIYIAYKYRKIQDKTTLKDELQVLSDHIDSKGHKSFILGRDVQGWKEKRHYSRLETAYHIYKNIGKHEVLFVYINSHVSSHGMHFEFLLAKLLGLKTIVTRHHKIKKSLLEKFSDQVHTFMDMEDLKEKLTHIFK